MKMFSSLFNGPVSFSSKQKVIKQNEISQLLEAKDILEEARAVAKRRLEETEKECEALKEQAIEQGKQTGLETFNEHILGLDNSAKKIYLETQKLILSIALKAAQKIVTKELEMHPDDIVNIVMQAMIPAKQNKKVTIFVSKDDVEILEKHKEDLKEKLEQIKVLSIQEKEDVSPGGCIIETETGIINASIENQWAALELAFKRYKQ